MLLCSIGIGHCLRLLSGRPEKVPRFFCAITWNISCIYPSFGLSSEPIIDCHLFYMLHLFYPRT
jgi:hypothetical protein